MNLINLDFFSISLVETFLSISILYLLPHLNEFNSTVLEPTGAKGLSRLQSTKVEQPNREYK